MEEESKMDDVFDETTNASVTQPPSSQSGGDKAKKVPWIRKRFRWTDEIRCVYVTGDRCACHGKTCGVRYLESYCVPL